ncbi:MAG TPA: sulfite exporter TauE/SafE family protein [Chitinophagaceae bacterium]|nr:sulfite exporter TauE/SafE family protein [Chitinophagaceae bacterium]
MSIAEIIRIALLLGTAGSLHCAGMCGPLAFALPVSHSNRYSRLAGGSVYNFGRLFAYTALGLLFGIAGYLFLSASWQQYFSVTLGIVILLYLLLPKKLYVQNLTNGWLQKPFLALRSSLARLFHSRKYRSLFFIGILNGLLPCGMVYLAITSSLLAGSSLKGGLFMFFFGIGTFPVMLLAVFGANYLNQRIRYRLSKAVPVFLFIMSVLLVLRGLGLGIPYLSPVISGTTQGAVSCH